MIPLTIPELSGNEWKPQTIEAINHAKEAKIPIFLPLLRGGGRRPEGSNTKQHLS